MRRRRGPTIAAFVAALAWAAAGLAGGRAQAAPASTLVVPIHGVIDAETSAAVGRVAAQARAERATLVLDIDTAGGLGAAALAVRDSVAGVPTLAYVSHRALAAGALVALSASSLVMAPDATIGDGEPYAFGSAEADRVTFAATALRAGHDPRVAGSLAERGVAFRARDAVRAHLAVAIEPSLEAALAREGAAPAAPAPAGFTPGERLVRLATSPAGSVLLLAFGILGFLIELQTLYGVGAALGVVALGVFFGTHVAAGYAPGWVVLVALAGLAGLALELHVVPGHGAAATGAGVALTVAVVLAFGLSFVVLAVQAIASAIVLAAAAFAACARLLPGNAWLRRVAFAAVQGPEYVASEDRRALVGRAGFATSYLRPAGVASIDGRRIDVLTEGDFVGAGAAVRVSRVDGARVFVRPVQGGRS